MVEIPVSCEHCPVDRNIDGPNQRLANNPGTFLRYLPGPAQAAEIFSDREPGLNAVFMKP